MVCKGCTKKRIVPWAVCRSPAKLLWCLKLPGTCYVSVTCYLQDYFGDALGGSIYNRGDIVVDGDAEFVGSEGGVRIRKPIYIIYIYIH